MTPSETAALQSRLDRLDAVAEERNTTLLKRLDGFEDTIKRLHTRADTIDEKATHRAERLDAEIKEVGVMANRANERLATVEHWQQDASEMIELMRDIKERLSLKYLGTVVVLIGGMVTLLNVVIGWFK